MACLLATACRSNVCTAGECGTASSSDNVKNGGETDFVCGGALCPHCVDGKKCSLVTVCLDGVCTAGTLVCAAPTCTDAVKNGSEADVDCGGPCAPGKRCADGKACATAGDCASGVCAANGLCAAATCTDLVKIGDESDADCGGSCPTKCAAGKMCGTSNANCVAGSICAGGVCAAATCMDATT